MNNNLKFLVTGGAGFIGSEIVRQLLDKGYYVRVADDLSKKDPSASSGQALSASLKASAQVDIRAEFVKADLTDNKATQEAFRGIDICINAAAKIGGIGYFHKYPATILSENNKLYSSTFEAAVKSKIQRMVYISSSMVFESAAHFPSREKDIQKIPSPISSYGFSKLTGEWYCHSFWDQYKLPFSICRPFNAYGINEFPEREVGYAHVIPDLVRKILSNQYPLELLGDGQQTRCFTHVSDIARGVIAVALHTNGLNEDFNIGSDKEIKMIDLAKKIWQVMEVKKAFKVKHKKGFKFDIKRRVPEVTKIKKMIGFQPEVKFEAGLKEVVQWLKKQKTQGKF
ncbi:hypothetical protein A2775_02795 [Candidatus Curtissbacteria bacterium RIFCSPHIGHO2_01_FULL_39_57]|nr:MAG: hypothetical protein A2775_02795 [Candidatus Curtissbacteria bacterium RIFCSPHIGHO2_01_FULL_39_57]